MFFKFLKKRTKPNDDDRVRALIEAKLVEYKSEPSEYQANFSEVSSGIEVRTLNFDSETDDVWNVLSGREDAMRKKDAG